MTTTAADAAYVAWVDHVHQLGGVATAWPFSSGAYGDRYGAPAARFPADVFASLAGVSLPVADGVQFNNPGTWVYVLATAMTGSNDVDQSAKAMLNATQAEAEQACAINGNCPTMGWEGAVRTAAIALGIFSAAIVTSKLLSLAKD